MDHELFVDQEFTVTAAGKEFKVTYKVEAAKAAVVEATYDDDTANQTVKLTVDGKAISAQNLINAGYNVKFEAFATKAGGTALTTLFDNDATGLLNTDLDATAGGSFVAELGLASLPTAGADVYVKVTLTKGSEVIQSELAKVKIQNTDLAADGITAFELTNGGVNGSVGTGFDDFVQNSKTLVTGETAQFTEITVKAGSETENVTTGYVVKSSDSSVVSVDSNGVLTAQAPGTATLTISYGGSSTTVAVTVTNKDREPAKVTLDDSALTAVKAGTVSTDVYLVDQYGDPLAATLTVVNSNDTVATLTSATVTTTVDPANPASIELTGVKAGSTQVTFKDSVGANISSTPLRVSVTENDDLAKYVLSVDSSISTTAVTGDTVLVESALSLSNTPAKEEVSTDSTLDLQYDKYAKINIQGVNSNGVAVTDQEKTAAEYTITVNQSRAGVLADLGGGVYASEQNGYLVIAAGTLTGTATITVTNDDDNSVVGTIKVTVTEEGINVTNATLLNVAAPTFAQTINYEDVLNFKAAGTGKDPVISGVTLTKATAQPVRLDLDGSETNTTGATSDIGSLYIDKDADGIFNNSDVLVGALTVTTTGVIADSANAPFDVVTGVAVASGDEGSVLFKVVDKAGNVVATKSVKVDF